MISISLTQFNQIFMTDDTPYSIENFQEEIGSEVVAVKPWDTIIDPVDPDVFRFISLE